MPRLGNLTPGAGGQVYQASGEATPSVRLPKKFESTTQAASPISDHMAIPSGYLTSGNSMVVQRAERTVGMRYEFQRGMHRQPIKRLGADGQPYPWNSRANPNYHGPTQNGSYNDALYQAGYPGFNLGLSFKVPTLPQNSPGGMGYGSTARPAAYTPININLTAAVNRLRRAGGTPRSRETQS